MKKTTIYLGLMQGDLPIPRDKAMKLIAETLYNLPGYTVLFGSGCWQSQSEQTLIVSYCGDDNSAILKLAKQYKESFKQDSVMIEIQKAEVNFI